MSPSFPHDDPGADEEFDPPNCSDGFHCAVFYEQGQDLHDHLRRFVGAGAAAGEACMVIATAQRLNDLHANPFPAGVRLDAAMTAGRICLLDSAACLKDVLVDGMPDPERFFGAVGDTVSRLRSAHGSLCIYQEMTAELWTAGLGDAAIRLEQQWGELIERYDCSLSCGYSMKVFESSVHRERFRRLCMEHMHVLPIRRASRDAANCALSAPGDAVLEALRRNRTE